METFEKIVVTDAGQERCSGTEISQTFYSSSFILSPMREEHSKVAVDDSIVWAALLEDQMTPVMIFCLGWQLRSGHLRSSMPVNKVQYLGW